MARALDCCLKLVVDTSDELRLSNFEEHTGATERRRELDERITRVRVAAKGLIAALDIDEAMPLDGAWLRALQEASALPTDDPVIPFVPPPDPFESVGVDLMDAIDEAAATAASSGVFVNEDYESDSDY